MFTLISLLALGSQAFAADLVSPFSLENTKVLPRNVRNPRVVQIFMAMDSKFSSSGNPVALGNALNKDVTTADLLKSQHDETDRNKLQALLDAEGIEGTVGRSVGGVNSVATVTVPALAWGLTDRFTLAAALPIYRIEVKAKAGFEKNEKGESLIRAIRESDPSKAAKAIEDLNRAAHVKAQDLRYAPIESRSVTAIGDLQMIGKFLVASEERQAFAIKPTLTIPTGREPDQTQLLDTPTGDGRLKAGAMLIHDLYLPAQLRWNQTVGYTVQFPHEMLRRMPATAEDPLSSDVERVERKTGNVFSFGMSLDKRVPRVGVTLGAAYNYQFQSQQQFGGSNSDASRYERLSALHPAQSLHSYSLTANFSTVEWYRASQFVYPFEATVAYSAPISGANVPTSPLMSAELVLFF